MGFEYFVRSVLVLGAWLMLTACGGEVADTSTVESATAAAKRLTRYDDPKINISIGDAPKQKLMGFGASQPRDQSRLFTNYDASMAKNLVGVVYGGLGMNWVRLWVHSHADKTVQDMKEKFYAGYIDNGYLALMQSSGAQHLLLAPARGESAPTEPMETYAEKLAQFIYDVYAERGIKIEVTGVANEPAGFSPEQIRDVVRLLRAKLDGRNMHHVAIIAAECASPDACAVNSTNAMKGEAAAWAGLRGIATHSYNMGVNAKVESLMVGTGKEYWMTEAGRALPRLADENPGETDEASGAAARFLNDMNHSVTHWIWFIGVGHYDKHPNNDSGQVLARPDDVSGGIKYNTKYHYFKQLRQAFDLGAQFRGATSAEEGRMNWGYGQKPAVTAAMARNADGSWAIGVVNTTGIADSRIAQFYPASSYQVSIAVPQEAADKKYQVWRSRPDGFVSDGLLRANRSGTIDLRVMPHELVTLRSMP